MRFLLDVNVGSTIADALVGAGHDVVRAALINATAEDADLLTFAANGDRILITFDRDFGELLFSMKMTPPSAVIYVRYQPQSPADVVARLMPLLDFDRLRGHMTVVEERRIRRTPFPMETNDNA